MRIMSYNILEGGIGRLDPLYEVIAAENPDVVLIQETWETPAFEKLAVKLNMDMFQAQSEKNPRGHVGVLSRYPILRGINYGPLENRLTRAAAMVTIQSPGCTMAFLCVHLHPYPTPEDEVIRLTEVQAVLAVAADSCRDADMCIIGGDFNSIHPDQTVHTAALDPNNLARITAAGGNIRRDVISAMLAASWIDAHACRRVPAQFDTTFTTAFPAMRVDYLFVPASGAQRVADCRVVKSPMARFASDHYPVVLELN